MLSHVPMKLACIDLDNTIADTGKMHLLAFREAFMHFGLKPKAGKIVLELFGLISEKMVKKLYPKLSSGKIKKITQLHNEIAIRKTYRHARIIPGAKNSLLYLKSKGYRIAIISNSSLPEIKKVLIQIGLSKKYYGKIISKEDVNSKPSPDGINLAKKLFRAEDSFMVGDTPCDINAGKRAHVKTIAVTTGGHSRKELMKYKPDFILNSIAEIKKIILQ